MDDLLTTSGVALGRRIHAGELSSRDVVEAHIARILSVNPALGAVVADRFDAARTEADAADAALAAGQVDPLAQPLHGVPCTIKECFAVDGMPWTSGSLRRVGTRATRDAPTVARLKQAGAIVLGVTNLSELCMWFESDNPVYGRTRNPYDPERIVGGSSGGEGAIVGAGASPFGLGSDVGGSIRMPAFFCGVFGHKAGTGVVPNTLQYPQAHGPAGRFLSTGPLTRRAEDLMPLLRILAGPDGEDEHCEPIALGDPSGVDLSSLTVAVVPGHTRRRVEPSLLAAVEDAASFLAVRGAHRVDAAVPALARSVELWSAAMGEAEGPGSFLRLLGYRRRRDLLKHAFVPARFGGRHTLPAALLGLVEDVGSLSDRGAARMRDQLDTLRHDLLSLMDGGVMLYPSHPRRAPRHRAPLLRPMDFGFTSIFNVLGLPVTQVPMGLHEGLPVGVQVVGSPGDDHKTIAVAMALEEGFGGWVPPWST